MRRQFRLSRSEDFARVKAHGKTWRHPLLMMGVAANDLAHNRVGMVVSKPFGNAVKRNRARRLIREALRAALPKLKAGYDLVLIARNELAGKPYTEVKAALEYLFMRAQLWQPPPPAQTDCEIV